MSLPETHVISGSRNVDAVPEKYRESFQILGVEGKPRPDHSD